MLIWSATAAARTLIVDGEGCGDYVTLEEAFDAVGDGDTIWVRPGVYHPAADMTTSAADVTLQGAARDLTVIDASLITDTMIVAVENFTLRDLTLRQSEGSGSLFGAQRSDGFDFRVTADNIVVEQTNASPDNEIWGFGVGYGTTTTVTNSVFRGVRYALIGYKGVNSLYAENNVFVDVDLGMFGMYSGEGFCADAFGATHNVFVKVGMPFAVAYGNPGTCDRTPEVWFSDNVLMDTPKAWAFGEYIFGEVTNNLLAPDAIDLGESYWGDILVHDNPVGDPQFIAWSDDGDWANDDFHLLPGSPAIDAGLDTYPVLPEDFDGRARPLDGDGDGLATLDLGPYEFDPAATELPVDEIPDTGDCVTDSGDTAAETGETDAPPDPDSDTPGTVDTAKAPAAACGCLAGHDPGWLGGLVAGTLLLRRVAARRVNP